MKFPQDNPITRCLSPKLVSLILIVIGCSGLYLSTIIRNPFTLLYPLALIFGVIIFSIFSLNSEKNTREGPDWANRLVLISIFVTLSLLIIEYYNSGFWRTESVFIFTFLLYNLVGLKILFSDSKITGLFLICVVGLLNRTTAYYASAKYVGIDVYSHSEYVNAIATEGSLEPLFSSKYFYSPFYHIQAASGELIFGLPTKDAISLTVLISVTIIPPVVIFSLTNRFWGARAGLLAALLYTSSDHAINWGIHLIPTSLGIPFFALILFTVMKYYGMKDNRFFVLTVGFLAVLMLTHQVSLFIAISAIIALAVSLCIYQFNIKRESFTLTLIFGSALFVDFMTTMFYGPESDLTFLDFAIGNFVSTFLESGTESRPEASFPADASISPGGAAAMADIQLLGSSMFLLFAVVGTLYWFSKYPKGKPLFAILSLGSVTALLMALAMGLPLIGMRNLMPTRWWAFIYIGWAILAAPGIIFIVQQIGISRKYASLGQTACYLLILIACISLMAGAAVASADNPYLNQGLGTERQSVTDKEVALGEHAESVQPASMEIRGDHRFRYGDGTLQMAHDNPNSIVSAEPLLLLDRQYLREPPAQYYALIEGQEVRVHGGVPVDQINPKSKSTLYSNGEHELHLLADRDRR